MFSEKFLVGTAGWAIPPSAREIFISPDAVKPNHLISYSAKLNAVEINSSFYREHQAKTYSKWRQSTPPGFRFSVKLAKRFTHEQKLAVDTSDLKAVIDGILHLEEKLGVILVQLPPKLSFDSAVAEDFFAALRELHLGNIALEARHGSWANREVTHLLEDYRIARVIADPARLENVVPIRSAEFAYYRLHGSPKVYYSEYSKADLKKWAGDMKDSAQKLSGDVWCMFDNTAAGFAALNALELRSLLLQP